MKSKILCVLLAIVLIQCASGFEFRTTIASEDLRPLLGHWTGTLTYLDYSSGEPYTMPAELEIAQDKNTLYFTSIYPDEPHANSTDTIHISLDGKKWGEEEVVSFRTMKDVQFELITVKLGTDGNDDQLAIIRHTYKLSLSRFTIVKQVKFLGTENWIERNEYAYTR